MIFPLADQASGIRTIVVHANAECGLKISLSMPFRQTDRANVRLFVVRNAEKTS